MSEKVKCPICNGEFSKYGIKNHISITHEQSRLAPTSSKRGYIAWNKGLTKETDERVKEGSEKAKECINTLIEKGQRWGCITSEYLNSVDFKKSCSRGGGYRENSGHSKKFHVFDSFGKSVCLQSSYELLCSEILDRLSIKWLRPKALKYDGKNYFADFYLPDYDIWLDPKNDYKALQDEDKIRKVREQNDIMLYVLLFSQLNEEFILSILG